MGKFSDYKKLTSAECHYCDYCTCQKNKRCNWYKQNVKSKSNKKRNKQWN